MDPDPDPLTEPPTELSVEQRQEFHFEGRIPSEEDLDEGEVFDPVTGGYLTPGWVPVSGIVTDDEEHRD